MFPKLATCLQPLASHTILLLIFLSGLYHLQKICTKAPSLDNMSSKHIQVQGEKIRTRSFNSLLFRTFSKFFLFLFQEEKKNNASSSEQPVRACIKVPHHHQILILLNIKLSPQVNLPQGGEQIN